MSARDEFGEPKIRYFLGDGAEAEAIKAEGLSHHRAYQDAVKAFVAEMGCSTVTESSRSGIVGLAFLEAQLAPTVARPGLRFDSRHASKTDGMVYQVYVADRRSNAGRAIVERIKKVGSFSFSE